MAPRLPSRAVKAHHLAVGACKLLRPTGARDRRRGRHVVSVEVIKRDAADYDGEQRRALAVVGEIDALARCGVSLVLFGEAVALVMDECSGHAELHRAAGVDVDAPVAGRHALARQTETRMMGLIAKSALDRGDRLFDRDPPFS